MTNSPLTASTIRITRTNRRFAPLMAAPHAGASTDADKNVRAPQTGLSGSRVGESCLGTVPKEYAVDNTVKDSRQYPGR